MAVSHSPADIRRRKEIILKVLKRTRLNTAQACEAAAITRQTYYVYLREDPEFKKAVCELDEARIDYAESKLMSMVGKEVPAAVCFFLKCKGKSRGYVEKSETVHSGEVKHTHTIEQNLNSLEEDKLASLAQIIDGECSIIDQKEVPSKQLPIPKKNAKKS